MHCSIHLSIQSIGFTGQDTAPAHCDVRSSFGNNRASHVGSKSQIDGVDIFRYGKVHADIVYAGSVVEDSLVAVRGRINFEGIDK